ncbi:7TM diverse intracellular signaling domain-containing protein [Billgrantia sp. Q4P2]|uniref:7TM diverse intracellular signaling domain-containing protein n=1 Tax=Billgrantia sp. Q4P2 TaxID=3463857 RepID=UPI0040575391
MKVTADHRSLQLQDGALIHRHAGEPLSLEEAQARFAEGRFERVAEDATSALNFGLTRDELWLQITLETAETLPRRWLLEVGHASLDHIDLYLAQEGGAFSRYHDGDRQPFTQRALPHRNPLFVLDLAPATRYILLMRVRSEGTLTVPMTLWQPDALWQSDQHHYMVLGLYYGLLLSLFIYNLFLFLSLRDPLYLTYVGFVGFLGIGQAGLSGLASQFLWPSNAWLANLSPIGGVTLAGLFGGLFVQRFLASTARKLRLSWLMPSLSLAYGLTFLCSLLVSYHLATLAVNLISLVFVAAALGMGSVSLYRREPGARFFVLAWFCLLLGVLVYILHNLGILPSNLWVTNAMMIGSSLEMLLLSLALADRIHDLQHQKDIAQAEALTTRQRMLEMGRQNEQVLEARIAERTQRLEEANRLLQQSHELLERQANHDVLTGLANRKLLNERLLEARARVDRHGGHLAMAVVDLNGFKPINDTLGHASGDRVLVELAQRLQATARRTDTVARVGGDEFVLLLESLAPEDREKIQRKLMACCRSPIEMEDGLEVTVSLSIGIALYPDDTQDLDTLFTLADDAMYRDKAASRAAETGRA